MTANSDLQVQARQALRGKWTLAVVAFVLFLAIAVLPGQIRRVGPLLSLILSGPMALGLSVFFLELARGGRPDIGALLDGFRRFPAAFVGYLVVTVMTLLWMLLLVIPGIVAALSYSMTFWVLADDPAAEPLDAWRRSKEMMRGKRWKLFCLYLRFAGWAILACLTAGIGFLWLVPYVQTSLARFYEDVRPSPGAAAASPEPVGPTHPSPARWGEAGGPAASPQVLPESGPPPPSEQPPPPPSS